MKTANYHISELILVITLLLFMSACASREKAIYRISLDGIIERDDQKRIKKAIEKANNNKGVLLLIDANSPGGSVRATYEIISAMDKSDVPIAVFVGPKKRLSATACLIMFAADIRAISTRGYVGTELSKYHKELKQRSEIPEEKKKILRILRKNFLARAVQYKINRKVAEDLFAQDTAIYGEKAKRIKLINIVVESEPELIRRLDGYRHRSHNVHTRSIPIVDLD